MVDRRLWATMFVAGGAIKHGRSAQHSNPTSANAKPTWDATEEKGNVAATAAGEVLPPKVPKRLSSEYASSCDVELS